MVEGWIGSTGAGVGGDAGADAPESTSLSLPLGNGSRAEQTLAAIEVLGLATTGDLGEASGVNQKPNHDR